MTGFFPDFRIPEVFPLKRLIILLTVVTALLLCAGAAADPAKTDGTVTAWIGEENKLFLKCTDGVTRTAFFPLTRRKKK